MFKKFRRWFYLYTRCEGVCYDDEENTQEQCMLRCWHDGLCETPSGELFDADEEDTIHQIAMEHKAVRPHIPYKRVRL